MSRVIRTELGRLELIICFDFTYSEFIRRYSLSNVEVIFCLSFMVDYRGWEDLIRAIPLVRAFENTAFYVHSDAVTRDRETAAMSFISNPQRLLASLEKKEGLILSTLDLGWVEKIEEAFCGSQKLIAHARLAVSMIATLFRMALEIGHTFSASLAAFWNWI